MEEALRKGELPVFFNREENLLYDKDCDSYKPLMNRLGDIIERKAYKELLECIKLKQ